jgi:hypothetical protein
LTGELATAQSAPAAAPANVLDEKTLTGMVDASKRFQADARAYIGGYADEQATARIEKHLETTGLDDKGLRRQLDEVNDWLTGSVPGIRQNLQQFKATEAKVTPIVKARFPTISDPTTPEGKMAAEVAKMMPELKQRSPAHAFSTAVYALGMAAYEHMAAATPEGDIIAAVRDVLKKHVPLPAANGAPAKPAALPGKPPAKAPIAGSPVRTPSVPRKDAESENASSKLREAPTAANMEETLKLALR